jgi:hypothetical protein
MLNETSVRRRAKALAEQDGFAWELNYRAPNGRFAKINLQGQRYLDDEHRQQYLERARAELQKEAEGRLSN